MKRIFKIIMIIAIVLICGILILFCSKVNKITLIENIKPKIVPKEKIQTVSEVKTIDVTELEDNRNYSTSTYIKNNV